MKGRQVRDQRPGQLLLGEVDGLEPAGGLRRQHPGGGSEQPRDLAADQDGRRHARLQE